MKNKVLVKIQQDSIRFVDLRFTDSKGKEQHVTISSTTVDEDFFKHGKMFDGSSIAGWRHINESDMILMPDLQTEAFVDPFYEEPTLVLRCDVVDPATGKDYIRDPRSVAKRAEAYLKTTGIADTCFFGPEPEFFIFDDVRFGNQMQHAFYKIDAAEGAWNSATEMMAGNVCHRPGVKGGYFPVPPVDSAQDLRSAMCLIMESLGMVIETHHHEVATACQAEINTKFASLLKKADEMQLLKYVIANVAHRYGKTVTFMPKPLVGDNGSGMHCHQSLFLADKNIFAGNAYAGLSDNALYYIGGLIKHAKALNAFCNASTNSYKRLVPGFEAPVLLAYSACNRSAAIRIPHVANAKARRIEVRFPDPSANPYLAFSAMLLAGLDGIQNKIHPGQAIDKNLYELPEAELKNIPVVCASLCQALSALDQDREFLTKSGVFSDDLIDGFIALKREEVTKVNMAASPVEFELYYSV